MAGEPIVFQPWMLAYYAVSKIQESTMMIVIKNRQEAYWLNESNLIIKISLKCPEVSHCLAYRELDYSVGSKQNSH